MNSRNKSTSLLLRCVMAVAFAATISTVILVLALTQLLSGVDPVAWIVVVTVLACIVYLSLPACLLLFGVGRQ